MSDKIVNHFVLADGSTAKYDAGSLINLDDTVSLAGYAPDAKAVGDRLAVCITETETTTTENIFPELVWSDGYMSLTGVVDGTGSNTYRHSQKYPVSAGDRVEFQNQNYSFTFITAFNGNDVVESAGQQGDYYYYNVPDGVDFIVISEYVSRGTAPIIHTYTQTTYSNILEDDVSELNETINSLSGAIITKNYTEETTTNISPEIVWTEGEYIQPNGGIATSSSFRHSNKIAVNENDIISYQNVNFKFRFLTAYSEAEVVIDSAGAQDVSPYVVPSGVAFVVVSDYISRGNAVINHTVVTNELASYAKPIPLGYMMESGTLSNGERLTLPYMQVKNYNRVVFNANITSFSSIKYVLGNASVEVDDTNLIITNASGTVFTIPHGLTIGKNITLLISTETEEYISHVRVSSDGNVYDHNTKFYAPSVDASQYIQSLNSTLTDCVFSWVSQNVNAPIWMFGDSYFSWYDTRWTYYLVQDGYVNNAMLNGFAGQGSSTAFISLNNLLTITTPKIVVWCLGMNDPDSATAVNATWSSNYNKIIELQKKYGFELVLYTTPTTPTMNNRLKNAIVRESGYRYIKADEAVRINDDGAWVTGALATDNVHPTEIGAKILYNRFLADLPELMCNR